MENNQFQAFEQGKGGNSTAPSVTPIKTREEVKLEMIKMRLKEIEEEKKYIQTKLDQEDGIQVEEEQFVELSQAEKEEIDSRSVYVGNVNYECTAEEVHQHFQTCGTINRITILSDAIGQPKGYAFVEFAEIESVQNALGLNESELHDRQLKVSRKRTNIPGMSQQHGWCFSGYYMPGPSFNPSYGGYGRFPRSKPNMRYSPY